jgi:hypothetical protein
MVFVSSSMDPLSRQSKAMLTGPFNRRFYSRPCYHRGIPLSNVAGVIRQTAFGKVLDDVSEHTVALCFLQHLSSEVAEALTEGPCRCYITFIR